jgi:hypothetical protein
MACAVPFNMLGLPFAQNRAQGVASTNPTPKTMWELRSRAMGVEHALQTIASPAVLTSSTKTAA